MRSFPWIIGPPGHIGQPRLKKELRVPNFIHDQVSYTYGILYAVDVRHLFFVFSVVLHWAADATNSSKAYQDYDQLPHSPACNRISGVGCRSPPDQSF